MIGKRTLGKARGRKDYSMQPEIKSESALMKEMDDARAMYNQTMIDYNIAKTQHDEQGMKDALITLKDCQEKTMRAKWALQDVKRYTGGIGK